MIKIFTLPVCPKCHILVDKMEELGIEVKEITMTDPEPQTELLMNDVYTNVTPVLFVDGRYYDHTQIFSEDGKSVRESIIGVLKKAGAE